MQKIERKEKIMNEGMENLKQIAELEEKCMKDKAIIEYVIRWLDSNIDEPALQRALATDSADLKEKIQLALVPEVTAQDVNNGDFG
jgi:hypothetical protein